MTEKPRDAAATRGGDEVELDRVHRSPDKLAHSVDELAVLASCGRDKLYQAIREGQLRARKFGRRTLITAEDAHRFLDSLPRLEL